MGQLWEDFKKKIEEGEFPKKILDEMGIERFCCRSVFLGQEDFIELVSNFKKA